MASAANATRGTLHFAHPLLWGGKESLDPASPVEFAGANVLLYNRLVRADADGIPQPELATAWEANADATTWTFTLREGVTFHDGSTFDAADVAYTFAHILDPALQSPQAATLGLITGTETPDEQPIVFQLSQGHADFPLLLSHRAAAIIPEGSAETIATTGIGTGPFKLQSLASDGATVLVANDDYWKGQPGLAGVELIGLADNEARTLAAQAGQVDLLFDATATQAELFAGSADFTTLSFPSGRWMGLVMRTDTAPFDDVRVRQALRLTADRQAMLNLVLNGEGTLACDTPVAPTDAYRLNQECPQDTAGAKALLAEAGYGDGLEVTLYTSTNVPPWVPLAEVYQQQAAAAGITVKLEVVPADSYWSEVWMKEPFYTTVWVERTADQFLNENWRSTANWNESHFQRAELDALLDEARATLDFAARRDAYYAAQHLIFDEGGHIIPFHFITAAIYQLAKHFPTRAFDPVLIEQFNREIEYMYDDCRDFVQAHYFITDRDDSAFWRANKNELTLSDSMWEKITQYKAGLPVNTSLSSDDAYQHLLRPITANGGSRNLLMFCITVMSRVRITVLCLGTGSQRQGRRPLDMS